MAWFASIVASTVVVVLATGSAMLVLGRRFIGEFTRPGVTVDQATPLWGLDLSRSGGGTSRCVAACCDVPIGRWHALLIHAEYVPLIALHHAHRLVAAASAAGRSIQAYYTPCNIHCGSYGHDPQRYMTLL